MRVKFATASSSQVLAARGGSRQHAGIAVDPPVEILADKLCALPFRAEVRDLLNMLSLVPGDYTDGELRTFLEPLQRRPARMAFPGQHD